MQPPSLSEFERNLQGLLDPEHHARPFISDGSPFDCEVAVVGINPATVTPFWPFWHSERGFNRQAWLSAYQADTRNKRNQTRPRIEVLVRELSPVRCLELNIFPYSSRNEVELLPHLRDTRVFNLMLSLVRPKLLFVFGSTPIHELAATFGVAPFIKNQFTSCQYQGRLFNVFATSHLSRGWSMQRVAALAHQLKERVLNGG